MHTLCYRDSIDAERKAKPFGATQLLLFRAISDERATDHKQAQFYRGFTRNPMTVKFESEDDGKMATYFARWSSRKSDMGPWSAAVSMRIEA